MAIELFNDGKHVCLMFTDLVEEENGNSVQSNQFLIVNNGNGILLDPGGVMTYNELFVSMGKYFPPKKLEYVFASHADPDIIASLSRWITGSETRLLISRVWSRFVPHFCPQGKTDGRIIPIPDEGTLLPLGDTTFQIVPAHFLHSEGNLQFYDPVSRMLFSGDMGASMMSGAQAAAPVVDFDAHIANMKGFHTRYMVSNKVCRYWAAMVRELDPEWIIPQHGAPFKGRAMVSRFLDWIEQLPCGVDVMTQGHYSTPKTVSIQL